MTSFKKIAILLFFVIAVLETTAQESDANDQSLILRLHGGPTLNNKSLKAFSGARLLIPATDSKRFGLTFSAASGTENEQFYVSGIILEQKLFGWLNSSIGTMGYFNYLKSGSHVPGITTSIGWEPNWASRCTPYVAYRSDFIFADDFTSLQSLYFGLNIEL